MDRAFEPLALLLELGEPVDGVADPAAAVARQHREQRHERHGEQGRVGAAVAAIAIASPTGVRQRSTR